MSKKSTSWTEEQKKKSNEKYPFRGSELPAEKRVDLAQKGLWYAIASIVGAVYKNWGQEGLDKVANTIKSSDRQQREKNLKRAGIQVGQASPRDIVRLMDANDAYVGIGTSRLVIEDPDENRIRVIFPDCNVANLIHGVCGKTCHFHNMAFDASHISVANPNIKFTMLKSLAAGDEACEFLLELTKP